MKIILIFCISFLTIQNVSAHENTERIKKLEVTVEQLSTQLAEKVVENKRLTAAMAEALMAERNGSRVVSGCDVGAIKRVVAFTSGQTDKESSLVKELKSHGPKCTNQQLEELRTLAKSIVFSGDSIPLIDYFLSN